MNARDELAKLLFTTDNSNAEDPEHEWEMTKRHNPHYAEYAFVMADAALAAGYRKPRTITTRDELDALPNASVVIDFMETVAHAVGRGLWTMGGDEYTADELLADWFTLPATVLYEPGAK